MLTHKLVSSSLIFILFVVLAADSLQAQELPLRVMSYNIRLDAQVDEQAGWGWSKRKQALCDLITLVNPDLFGLQEVVVNQLEYIAAQFPDYAYVGSGRDDGKSKGEFSPIFFNKVKFDLLASGTFWLSETPEVVGSKGWDAAICRVCSWVKLKSKQSGKVFFQFNTHFDHIGKQARAESAKLILRKIVELVGSVVHTGDIGAGNVTKLANQVIVALNIAAMSEALVLATKAGVDPNLVFQAIRGGLAGSTVLEAKAPMVMDRNFKPGFRIDLHIKDLANALDTSHGVGAQLPLTSLVMEMMQALKADGHGQSDHSAIARYYENLAKVEVTR